MHVARRRNLVVAVLLLLAAIVGAGLGSASANSNSVPTGLLGQASTATSTYTLTGVSYMLDPSNPRYVGQVAFTISPANPRVVSVRLYSGGSWYSCANASGSVTCSTTSPVAPATSASTLTVVASQ